MRQLYIQGLLTDGRHFWVADDTFDKLLEGARCGLRSAVSRLANEPQLVASAPCEASAFGADMESSYDRVRHGMRMQIDDTYRSKDQGERDRLYAEAIAALPTMRVVLLRIEQYNQLVNSYLVTMRALTEARARGDQASVTAFVAQYIRFDGVIVGQP